MNSEINIYYFKTHNTAVKAKLLDAVTNLRGTYIEDPFANPLDPKVFLD
jgi:hypothetical protein